MTTTVLFPGQGSQVVGMGREAWAADAEARALFAEADDVLWWASDIAWANNASIEDDGTIRVAPLGPRVIRLHLLGQAIFELGGKSEGGDLARLLDRLERGENGNLGGVLATVEGEDWVFRPEPPRRTG